MRRADRQKKEPAARALKLAISIALKASVIYLSFAIRTIRVNGSKSTKSGSCTQGGMQPHVAAMVKKSPHKAGLTIS